MIRKVSGGYHVVSSEGKNLGGPYKSLKLQGSDCARSSISSGTENSPELRKSRLGGDHEGSNRATSNDQKGFAR
ncbi:MAG: hypothetical protein ABSH13_15010 [Candidatus Acidiferrum sp.]|jgi:hypothetical protein